MLPYERGFIRPVKIYRKENEVIQQCWQLPTYVLIMHIIAFNDGFTYIPIIIAVLGCYLNDRLLDMVKLIYLSSPMKTADIIILCMPGA